MGLSRFFKPVHAGYLETILNGISLLVSIAHHDALLSELGFATVQFSIGHTNFTQNGLNVKIKPATNDYQVIPLCLAVGSEFREILPYVNMTADKLL